jgi:hypothetical protein
MNLFIIKFYNQFPPFYWYHPWCERQILLPFSAGLLLMYSKQLFTPWWGGGVGSGGPTGHMIYVLYCLYSTWGYLGVLGGGADLIILVICTFWGVRGGGCRATCLFLVLRLRRRGVFLVLVQNLSARGLVQKPSKYSLSSSTLHRKKTQKTTKIFTFKHQKISLAFPF